MLKKIVLILILFLPFVSKAQNDFWVIYEHNGENGYIDSKGKIVIPAGKYTVCMSDTFRTYAIVLKENVGFVAIDRQEKVLYSIFMYDNGPDYSSEGLFRIINDNKKIGYADEKTGKVVIKPQYDCAYPFENNVAKVSSNCSITYDDDHTIWNSKTWFNIDKKGVKVNKTN